MDTCEEEGADWEGAVAIISALEEGAGTGKIERESSVMRVPNRAGSGSVLLEAGVAATKDAEAEEEEEEPPKQLESGSAAGT